MLKHRVQHSATYQGSAPGSPGASRFDYGQSEDFPAPPTDLDLYHIEQDAHAQSHNYDIDSSSGQKCNYSIQNPSIVVQNCSNNPPQDMPDSQIMPNMPERHPSPVASNEYQGVQTITERYDRVGNLSPVSRNSPLSSPSSEGAPLSFSDLMMSQKFKEGVTESDLLQVETFYRSHKTDVYVCGCLVNMYFGTAKSAIMNEQWTFSCTGIPLLLLDTGEHHRERKLSILIAEKGTGFTLWRDVIDNQTGYRTPNANFHTMHVGKDHTKLAGLSFDDAAAATEFYNHVKKLTADPEDDLLKPGNIKKKKSVKDKKKKIKLPKKTEISNPCCFVHVTKLEPDKVAGLDQEKNTEAAKPSNSNEISAPFNFQHVTGPTGTGRDVESVSNMIDSKMTLTCSSSVDSGLSEDRSST